MKFTRFTLALALSCGLNVVHTRAAPPEQSAQYRQAASDYSYFGQEKAQPSPSDAPVAAETNKAVVQASADEGAGCAAEEEEEATCDPWRLFPGFGCGWTLTGYLNASATANSDSPGSHYNGPVTFMDREDVRVNQLYGILEKKADNGGCGLAWGARMDLLYGTDYIFTMATGLETHQDGTNKWNSQSPNIPGAFAQYGLAMPQAYVEAQYNDLNLKAGHFYAPVGYQVVQATGNFFVTQPYTFQYGEPFTWTGLNASWKYSDELTLLGSAINGWDKFDAQSDKLAVMGGFTYAPSHGAYIINNTTTIGEEDGTVLPIVGRRFLNSLVFTYNVSEKVQYVFQNDIGSQQNGVAPGVDGEWYGLNQYLFYTVNECWKLGVRGEWFRDDDGIRLAAAPIRLGGAANAAGLLGVPLALPGDLAGNYYEFAIGANWTPSSNLVVRPELRWDWTDGTVAAPFNDLTKDSQFLAMVDAIILF